MATSTKIIQADDQGRYGLSSISRADVAKIDISDVDLLITSKSGEHYLLPGGGLAAMSDHPPGVLFADGVASVSQLMGEVGAVLSLANAIPMPSSVKLEAAKNGGATTDAELAARFKELQRQNDKLTHELQQKDKQITEQKSDLAHQKAEINKHTNDHQNDDKCVTSAGGAAKSHDCLPKHESTQVSSLTVNTEATVEQLVEKAQKIEENLHKSDFDYVPPHHYDPPPVPVASPPGVPPPISMTPIVSLFMGNVVGTTVESAAGVTFLYGGGGAVGSDSSAQIGPRDALQFSAATIEGTSGNDVIYTDGPLVGNSNPTVARTNGAKEFTLNVAGYFTTLNDIKITGVPVGVAIVGATMNGDGSWTLPAAYVIHQSSFKLIYDTVPPASGGTFDLTFEVSGITTRHVTFDTKQSFRFKYLAATSTSQVTDPTLVYDDRGISKQIYVLPTLDQPNIINSGQGDDVIYGSRNADIITAGDGANQIFAGGGNNVIRSGGGTNTITAADGDNSIVAGDGTNAVTLGNGANVVTLGNGVANTIVAGDGGNIITVGTGDNLSIVTGAGADRITTAGGSGAINAGAGSNSITINSAAGSTKTHTLTTTGTSGTNTIIGGDGLYVVTMGAGVNNVTLGNGTDAFDTQITVGPGTNTISTGNGRHTISVGSGVNAITTGAGLDVIRVAGGRGTISAGDGANTIVITAGNYNVTAGAGNDTVTAGDGDNTINVGSGNNSVTVGNGNNTLIGGAGNDSFTVGSGNNTFRAGLGTNVIAGGSGSNTMDFSDITTTALTVTVGNGSTHGSATGTGVSDDLLNISTIIGTNLGDAITLTSGTRTVYAGSGNDILRAGTGQNILYGGNGNNTFYGNSSATTSFANGALNGFTAYLYGGTGNNTFLTPSAGTFYNATNGASLAPIANNLAYTVVNGATTTNLYMNTQINLIDYSSDNSNMTISLVGGTGSGGTAEGSVYAAAPITGYSSINALKMGNGTDTVITSKTDTLIIAGTGGVLNVDDSNTIASENVILVGRGTDGRYTMGAARETVVGSTNITRLYYDRSPAGVVVNLDSVSHTFHNTLYSKDVTIAAYSGGNWGLTAADATSYSTGDIFVPINGASLGTIFFQAYNASDKLVYGGSSFTYYYDPYGTARDYFYGGSGGSFYYMSNGNDAFVGSAVSRTNNFFYNNTNNNTTVVLDKTLDPRVQDAGVSVTRGGITYSGFAFGYDGATTAGSNYTLLSNVGLVVTLGGNDYIVGDNNGNQINAGSGNNTIIDGSGANIITAIQGTNTINAGTGIHNTLNFATVYDGNSEGTSGVLAGYSPAANAGVEVFLGNGAFFNSGAGGDQAAFWGSTSFASTYQVRTGAGYSVVQTTNNANGVNQSSIQNINGGNYASGVVDSVSSNTFGFDHAMYGDANANIIRGHGGNNLIAGGGGADSLYGGTGSNIYYLTPTQLTQTALINGSANGATGVDILRVPGLTWTSGTDPFTSANNKFVSLNVVDVRTGADSLNGLTQTATAGAGSTTHSSSFNLSALDIQNINDNGASSTVTLKLDNGSVFTATVGSGTGALSAVENPTHTTTDTTWRFYSDAGHSTYNATNLVATLNVHYGV